MLLHVTTAVKYSSQELYTINFLLIQEHLNFNIDCNSHGNQSRYAAAAAYASCKFLYTYEYTCTHHFSECRNKKEFINTNAWARDPTRVFRTSILHTSRVYNQRVFIYAVIIT